MTPSATNNQISIYPIEVTIECDGGPHKGNALKINDQGMILEVFVSTFSPQQTLTLKWLLPVDNISMQEDVIVIKKYTQNRSGKIIYLMEVHFKKIKLANASAILTLLGRFEGLKKQTGSLSIESEKPSEAPTEPDEKKPKS
jgi:hypothetical protein